MNERNGYSGSVTVIAGLIPKNNGSFPLLHAHDIQVDENGKRLDEKLGEIGTGGQSPIGLVVVDGKLCVRYKEET